MFEDLDAAEKRSEDDEKPSSNLYRWSHFHALLVFGVLIIPFHGYSWGWQVAIAGGYTVYVFWFAFGSVLHDADDFFGDPRVLPYAAKLLVPHLLVLAILIPAVSLWFRLKPMLPDWATHAGQKGSIWMLFGWMVLALSGIAEGFWMGEKLKRLYGKKEERD